jgi:hypothetical protein
MPIHRLRIVESLRASLLKSNSRLLFLIAVLILVSVSFTRASNRGPAAAASSFANAPGRNESQSGQAGLYESSVPDEPGQASKPSSIIPIYTSFDFLRNYLTNLTYPILVQGKPWDFGSTNMVELRKPNGGNSYWDYWNESEPWDSPNHLWQDDQGQWHSYQTEMIEDSAGHKVKAYLLFDKKGPGVMDKLWFTHDPAQSFMAVLGQFNILSFLDPPEVTQWGNLSKLGNLRIEVDDRRVYDGPILDWFSGDAQKLPPALRQVVIWKYNDFGSNGNIIPIPYQKRLKVLVYGGASKPKWFMATGLTFPPGTVVRPYTGPSDLPLTQMEAWAQNALHPEDFINVLRNQKNYQVGLAASSPATFLFRGSGTLAALRFKFDKQYDPKQFHFQVRYGEAVGIDLPLLAFFGEPDSLTLHHSTPIGIIESGNSYLFYSNLPMPYQNGMTIQLSTDSTGPVPVTVQFATLSQMYNTQLRVRYQPSRKLEIYGPDYTVALPGDGKLVGLVLVTKDQDFDKVPQVVEKGDSGKEDPSKKACSPSPTASATRAITAGKRIGPREAITLIPAIPPHPAAAIAPLGGFCDTGRARTAMLPSFATLTTFLLSPSRGGYFSLSNMALGTIISPSRME